MQSHYLHIPQTMQMERIAGADVSAEIPTANGRIDLLLKMPRTIYVLELKYNHTPADAIEQINQKDYASAFANDSRPIVKVGINFSSDNRTVVSWTIE